MRALEGVLCFALHVGVLWAYQKWALPFWKSFGQDTPTRKPPEDFLMGLVAGLQAGLPPAEAFARSAHALAEPNPDLVGFSLRMAQGESFREALGHLKSTEFRDVAPVLEEGVGLGVPLIPALKALQTRWRLEKKARLQEKVETLPLKLLFPLVLFQFPSLMILLCSSSLKDLLQQLGL